MYTHIHTYIYIYINLSLCITCVCVSIRVDRYIQIESIDRSIVSTPISRSFLQVASVRPPTRAWEVARTVVAPPSSVVKCLWEVFVWGFGRLFLSCVCVGGVVLCRCVCV